MIAFLPLLMTQTDRLVFEGKGHKPPSVVFLTGDEEYRSEEGLPQLAKILSTRLGFKCTVLFSLNKAGEIDPNTKGNEPGLEALDTADLCVMLLRFRQWPDDQMRHFVNYYQSGRPIIALRTSTHAFAYDPNSTSRFKKFSWDSRDWPGGFGKQVLGETWISHWGSHKKEATKGIVVGKDPILTGIDHLFGTTDVYEASPPVDAHILVRGEVLSGMFPESAPATYSKKTAAGLEQSVNNPMMPIAWTRQNPGKVFTCTMGAATDLLDPGLRRLLVNACYWCLGKSIPKRCNVDLVGDYRPSMFGFDGFRKGVKPADLANRG